VLGRAASGVPWSRRAPLAARQSSYGISPKTHYFFFNFYFSLPFSCALLVPWMKSKKSRLQPAEVGKKIAKKKGQISAGKIFEFSRLNSNFSRSLTSAG